MMPRMYDYRNTKKTMMIFQIVQELVLDLFKAHYEKDWEEVK